MVKFVNFRTLNAIRNRFVTWWSRLWSNPAAFSLSLEAGETLEAGTPYTLHKDPLNGNSRALGLNDDDEFQKVQDQLAEAITDLDEANRQLKLLRKWYEDFEDLTDWMHMQGLWNGEDVDETNPMQTYKNGLKRYLNKKTI